MGAFLESIIRRLERPRTFAIGIAAAALLSIPSLFGGLAIDDYMHLGVTEGLSLPGVPAQNPLDAFVFVDGDPSHLAAALDIGVLPWWSSPNLHLAFFRPLSAFTMLLDHVVAPRIFPLWHLQSLLWYVALVFAVGLLYRRVNASLAGLALFLYAVDDAHALTVGWLANRNALIAALFGVLSLLAYDSHRRKERKFFLLLSLFWLAVALLAGEAAIATTAYLFAYALFLDKGRLPLRLLRILPHGLLVLAWNSLYGRLGYAATGSGLYVDPRSHPGWFALLALKRIPMLLAGELAFPPSSAGFLMTGRGTLVLVGFCLFLLGFVGLLLSPLLRRRPAAAFFGLGMLLSSVPIAATFPSDRLLIFAGIGGSGLIAVALNERSLLRRRRAGRLLVSAFIVLHLIAAPILFPLRSFTIPAVGWMVEAAIDSVKSDPDLSQQQLILVNAPSEFISSYLPGIKLFKGEDIPLQTRLLASALREIRLTRTDERTLALAVQDGFLKTPVERLLSDGTFPPNFELALTGMTVRVTDLTEDGRPLHVRFRFDEPLESPSYRWFAWHETGFVPFTPPSLGESTILAAWDPAILLR